MRSPSRPCPHNEARPHLQRCDRGVDGPGAGDDGPPAAGEGGHMLPAHQLQGELAIPAHQHGSDGGLANASQAWRARARTTRHARTCPPCPCSHDVACAPAAGRVSHPSTHVHAKLSPHARTRWRKSALESQEPCKAIPTRTHQVAQTSVQEA